MRSEGVRYRHEPYTTARVLCTFDKGLSVFTRMARFVTSGGRNRGEVAAAERAIVSQVRMKMAERDLVISALETRL